MKKLYKIFLTIAAAFMIGATVIPSSTSVIYANSMKYEEVVPFRDRGVCGDMNKNSYTYKRYCLKDGSASATLTPAQRDCLGALGLGVFSFSTTWYSLLMAYGPVVYQCLKA
ncbi:hypothetical protein D8895_13825 [Streptococcus sp. BCA20]|uniref:Uncharacterized protein n=1 Tax=Streptococcus intermedius TaxID=1338 RepID=A0AAD1FK89_STRIT|nr:MULTISPECIES: hypothetical protein [Streptococcus]RSJ01204.1 hypothetical protein D8895_13825 [Streptococcus sp. BCA20]EHG11279.1 hypothetical protein HMPREF9177_01858 [Streptococcus intermedius F0413]QKH77293.1 hypothetical protein FOC71_01675 [Streptococcus intermedius]RSJ19160.1 hypothetical protein D8829_07710 [Streptococcus intermedius]VEE84331.1 Uncharacterised protein [Streptococcus milleri]